MGVIGGLVLRMTVIQILRKMMAGNRRKYPRVRTDIEVTMRFPSMDREPIRVRVRNLSASGMEVILEESLPVLSELEVEMPLLGEDVIQVTGRLVRSIPIQSLWDRVKGRGQRFVVGINFVDLEQPLRTKLIRHLQQTTA